MRIYCQNCGQHFDIPEEKIPNIDRVKFTCPQCGEKNRIDLRDFLPTSEESLPKEEETQAEEIEQGEEERFPVGSSTALLFGQEGDWKEKCRSFLQDKGYYLTIMDSVKEASRKLKTNTYQVLLFEDLPEAEELLQEIGQWPGKVRRGINCLLIGDKRASLDTIYSFQRGVNAYLSYNQQPIEEFLEQAMAEYSFFYEPWRIAQEDDKPSQSR